MSLADFVYNPDEQVLTEALEKFSLPETKPFRFQLVRFECISPDSFMWRLRIGDSIYYLYAEDFVEGLDDVKGKFADYMQTHDFELVPVRESAHSSFKESSPVMGASVYKEPADSERMMNFALPSGHYFAFLAQSREDSDWALFSDRAPGGHA